MSKIQQAHPVTKAEREDNHHYAVELADWKSKVRKQRQELYVCFSKAFFFHYRTNLVNCGIIDKKIINLVKNVQKDVK